MKTGENDDKNRAPGYTGPALLFSFPYCGQIDCI
jgi:hypothetical protein